MKFSIIIPNWNGRKLLEKNLPAVLATKPDEIIVVDDASPDDSVTFLEKNYLSIKIVKHKKNLGFAVACNSGVKVAKGEIVVLLNLDVIPKVDLLKRVLPHFKDERVFAVSFNEVNNPEFSWTKGKYKDGFIIHESQKKDNKLHETFWASGGSAAFRKSTWEKLGGMDETFAPFYWEDIDLCYRAKKRGWKILWSPTAKVVHKHEGIIGKNFAKGYINHIWERNQLIFIWKNLTDKDLFKKHILGIFLRLRHPGYIKVILAALVKIPQILKKRQIEIAEEKILDKKILHGI